MHTFAYIMRDVDRHRRILPVPDLFAICLVTTRNWNVQPMTLSLLCHVQGQTGGSSNWPSLSWHTQPHHHLLLLLTWLDFNRPRSEGWSRYAH